MKKRIISLLCALVLLLSLVSCGKGGSTLPSLAALAGLPESRLSEALQGYQRDDLLLTWGVPVRSMDGALGDTWALDDSRELTVLYNEYNKVFVVLVKTP